jgi:hypothetical protein
MAQKGPFPPLLLFCFTLVCFLFAQQLEDWCDAAGFEATAARRNERWQIIRDCLMLSLLQRAFSSCDVVLLAGEKEQFAFIISTILPAFYPSYLLNVPSCDCVMPQILTSAHPSSTPKPEKFSIELPKLQGIFADQHGCNLACGAGHSRSTLAVDVVLQPPPCIYSRRRVACNDFLSCFLSPRWPRTVFLRGVALL